MGWHVTALIAKKRVGSTTRKLLLLSMGDKANNDGSGVYASFATLGDMCESSRATVKRIIKEFEAEGLVEKVGQRPCANGDKNYTNDYTLVLSAIEALPDVGDPKADPDHSDPGQEPMNPVQGEPGSPRTGVNDGEPGSPRPPTRFTMNPKPIQEPIGSSSLRSEEPQTSQARKAKSGERSEPKGTRLPADWTPSAQDRAFALKQGLDPGRIQATADEFRDYWRGVPGAKGRKLDWSATWRNRVRDVAGRQANPSRSGNGAGGHRSGISRMAYTG